MDGSAIETTVQARCNEKHTDVKGGILTGVDIISPANVTTADGSQERVTSVVDIVDVHGTMYTIDGDGIPGRNRICAIQE